MSDIKLLASDLSAKGNDGEGIEFSVQPIPGEVEVLQIVVEGREELPIFISMTGDEILCIAYLFTAEEVNKASQAELHDVMLSMNIPMPLSSFAKIENQYVVYGALSSESTTNDVINEIEILSDNTLEAIEALQDFLS